MSKERSSFVIQAMSSLFIVGGLLIISSIPAGCAFYYAFNSFFGSLFVAGGSASIGYIFVLLVKQYLKNDES